MSHCRHLENFLQEIIFYDRRKTTDKNRSGRRGALQSAGMPHFAITFLILKVTLEEGSKQNSV